MKKYIHLSDQQNRDAVVIFESPSKQTKIKMVTADGSEPSTTRILKSHSDISYESLFKKHGSNDNIANAIINEDPEIDLMETGKIVKSMNKVYIDNNLRPVFRIKKIEVVHDTEGNIKEERIPKELLSNIVSDIPIKPTGKLFPKNDIYNKLVFAKKYQIIHINGLTFDFLYGIAKELHEKQSLMMIGGGNKGTEPIVFQDGGKGYRAFLEGRVKENTYQLIMHLSNLELKGLKQSE